MPPFFIPIVAFFLWGLAVFFYLPGLRSDLRVSNELFGSLFFLSYDILFLAWLFSGPLLAVILSFLCAAAAVYVTLSAREPEALLQLFGYALFFMFCLLHFQSIQKRSRDKFLEKEKLNEGTVIVQKELLKAYSLKKAGEEKINRFLGFQKFSESLKEKKTTGEAAREIVSEAIEHFHAAEECALYLIDPKKQDLVLVFGERPDGGPVRDKGGTPFDRWVMRRSKAIVVEDARNDFRFLSDSHGGSGHKSVCVSPLITENKVLGVLRVSSEKPEAFKADDLRLLDIFSSLGAVTIRNILLYEKMGELAIRDSLTGLYLHRYFQERLSEEIKRATMDRSSFSLAILDVDFFKRYNDDYGHAAGDFVLKNTASLILGCVDSVDLVGRYGGEEFEILMPGKTKVEAIALTEKIRALIEKNRIVLRRVETRVTASFGISAFPEDGRSSEELIRKADKCLYKAKNMGRNRVCGSI